MKRTSYLSPNHPPLFFFNALILRTLFSYKNKRKQHNLVLLIVKSLIDSFLAQRLVRCPGSSSLVVRGGWCNPNPQTILENDTRVFFISEVHYQRCRVGCCCCCHYHCVANVWWDCVCV